LGARIKLTNRLTYDNRVVSEEWLALKPAKLIDGVICFELPGLPPTTNVLNTKHWAAKKSIRDDWQGLISVVTSQCRPVKPYHRAHLTLTRYSTRCPDSDGLVGSFKYIIDGLVKCRVLEDDSYQHIGMPTYLWEKSSREESRIKVEIKGSDGLV
jgi:hypothetical protein